MAAVYSTQFASGVQTGAGSGTLFTVPSGYLVVVRSIQIFQYTGTAETFQIADGSGVSIATAISPGAPWQLDWDGRAVLNAGETIEFSTGGGGWTYRVSGYLLTV